jgi:CreA protein
VAIPKSDEVFGESHSILFKKMRIVRMVDPSRQVVLYLAYTRTS